MRRLYISSISLFLVLFFSCTKDRIISYLPPANPSSNGVPVFRVSPTNSDDTENILKAFADAKASGPGSIVQLVFGRYSIRPVEILDFDGFFQGYGRGITIVSNVSGLPCDDLWNINNIPYLIQFVGGKVTVSDMTLQIQDGTPCNADSPVNRSKIGDLLGSILVLADHTSNYVPANQHFKCVIRKVDFIAGNINGGFNPYGISGNTYAGIYCGSPFRTAPENNKLSEGDITITGCTFDQNVNGLFVWGFGENSSIIIENNNISGSVYNNLVLSCLGSNIRISKNTFVNGLNSDLYINDNDNGNYPGLEMKKSTDYIISENDFSGTPSLASLYMIDNRRLHNPDEGFPQHFDIYANSFHIPAGGAAIAGLNNVGASISGNFFDTPRGEGIIIDGDRNSNIFSRDVSISGNIFENVKYLASSIVLGPYTTNCKVVCATTDKVMNYGINNSISLMQTP